MIPVFGRFITKIKTSEYIITHIQVKEDEIHDIFLQIPIMKEPYPHASVFSLVTIIKYPVPETMIASEAYLKFVPYGPYKENEMLSVGRVFKKKMNWNSFLEEINKDKELKHTFIRLPKKESAGMITAEAPRIGFPGYLRLTPYKGWTIIELVIAPQHQKIEEMSEEYFSINESIEAIKKIITYLRLYGIKKEGNGEIIIENGNQFSIPWAMKRIDDLQSGNIDKIQYAEENMEDFQRRKLHEFENLIPIDRINRNKRIYLACFGISFLLIMFYIFNLFINIMGNYSVCYIFIAGLIITLTLFFGVYFMAKNSELKKIDPKDTDITNYLVNELGYDNIGKSNLYK
jgi:hypothetical protein